MPSYKEELEAMMNAPGAEYLFLKPRCHPDSAITAAYSKSLGSVVIACATCNFGVADLAVASRGAGLNNLLPRLPEIPPPTLPKPKGRAKPKLEVVPPPATPTHVQDQRNSAKANRRRRK